MFPLRKKLDAFFAVRERLIIIECLLQDILTLSLLGLIALETLEALLPGSASERTPLPILIAFIVLVALARESLIAKRNLLNPKEQPLHISEKTKKALFVLGALWFTAILAASLVGFPLLLIPFLVILLTILPFKIYRVLFLTP